MSENLIPSIFEPFVCLRSGIKYRCLRDLNFLPTEREWICKYIIQDQPNSTALRNLRISDLCFKCSLYTNILDEWVRHYENIRNDDLLSARSILESFNYEEGLNNEDIISIDAGNVEFITQ